jgi:hypothetical protein
MLYEFTASNLLIRELLLKYLKPIEISMRNIEKKKNVRMSIKNTAIPGDGFSNRYEAILALLKSKITLIATQNQTDPGGVLLTNHFLCAA